MTNSFLLILSIGVPVLGSFILPVISRLSSKARNLAALLLISFPFVSSLLLLGPVLSGERITFLLSYANVNLRVSFIADTVAVGMALVSSFIYIA